MKKFKDSRPINTTETGNKPAPWATWLVKDLASPENKH